MRPLEGVRELRELRMLSQQELANRAGVSLFTIQRIERGVGSVRPSTGRAVARALGVRVEELLGKAQAPLPLEFQGRGAGRTGGEGRVIETVEEMERVALHADSALLGAWKHHVRQRLFMWERYLSAAEERLSHEERRTVAAGIWSEALDLMGTLEGAVVPAVEVDLAAGDSAEQRERLEGLLEEVQRVYGEARRVAEEDPADAPASGRGNVVSLYLERQSA